MMINPITASLRTRRSILENQFYTDEMSIERMTECTDEYSGLTHQERIFVADEIPCRLSINGYPSISSFSTHKESNSSLKIFTAPEVDLREGDLVRVTRYARLQDTESQEFLLIAGKPLLYDSHKEVVMSERTGV